MPEEYRLTGVSGMPRLGKVNDLVELGFDLAARHA